MFDNVFENARKFIYRNARPIDLALWRYEFESGSRKDVIDILSEYQNADGGFGNAIEPDFWNVQSSPIATWKAIQILNEIGIDPKEKIVKNILKYLDSGKDFENGLWYNTVKSNNDYPHAIWWECNNERGVPSDNPTFSLAGFAYKYSEKNSALAKKSAQIIKNGVSRFMAQPFDEMHTLRVMLELYDYCTTIDGFDLFDLKTFKSGLYKAIGNVICTDIEKWFKEYVCTPSSFFDKNKTLFDIIDPELCKKEGDMIMEQQLPDGSYPITWVWYNDYTEYYIAANWWKSHILRMNMLYLNALRDL